MYNSPLSVLGLPDPKFFPYDNFEARVAQPNRFPPSAFDSVASQPPKGSASRGSAKSTSSHIFVPHDSPEPDLTRKIDLATALQYGTSRGYAPLRVWVNEFATTKMTPNAPYQGGFDTIFTLGNTDGFSKSLYAFSNIWDDRKDWLRDRQGMLCEEFSFTPPLTLAKSRGLNVVGVAIDDEGMLAEGPGGLRDVLENWDRTKGRLPHLMYTITVGQNPTGGVLSIERKQQIYSLCSKYDILIIEDDPYWFLQYPSAYQMSARYKGLPPPVVANPARKSNLRSSGSPFLDSLAPSYLSIDVDGRVIRLDTFSKNIAPGCRMGWMTAQPSIIACIERFADLNTQQPSGFVQSMVVQLLRGHQTTSASHATSEDQLGSWQMDGFIRWLEGLRGNYERRMQIMSQILHDGKYKVDTRAERLSKRNSFSESDDFEIISKYQMLDFAVPMGGMFLWLRVCFENHPLFNHPDIPHADLSRAFWLLLLGPSHKVLVLPGSVFAATPKLFKERGWQYFRLCFAAIADDILAANSHALVRATNEFFEIEDPQIIRDLIDQDPGKDAAQMAELMAEMEKQSGMSITTC